MLGFNRVWKLFQVGDLVFTVYVRQREVDLAGRFGTVSQLLDEGCIFAGNVLDCQCFVTRTVYCLFAKEINFWLNYQKALSTESGLDA